MKCFRGDFKILRYNHEVQCSSVLTLAALFHCSKTVLANHPKLDYPADHKIDIQTMFDLNF